MNKAFVRESEDHSEYCPRCGSAGLVVRRDTVLEQLPPGSDPSLAVTANFCPHPPCEVAYFDMFERTVLVSDLKHSVYPKDFDAPICRCFGFTTSEIDLDVAEGGVSRTKALLERAKNESTHCETLAANGRSCIPDVQRYYMQHKR